MDNNKNNRERKVNIDALSSENLEQISAKLGEKLGRILQKAAEEANNFLKIYGLNVEVAYNIKQISEEKKEE